MMLKGKRVVVTGGGKGIGRSVSLSLARNGADLSIASRTKNDVDVLVDEISSKYSIRVMGSYVDVAKKTEASKLIEDSVSFLGGIDAVICAAGYPLLPDLWDKSLHNLDDGDLLKVFEVDVLGSFHVIKAALPAMMRQQSGVIVAFSSTPAVAGYDKGGAYAIAKAANLGLVREIASEYGRYNIRAYAIAPGNIMTNRTYDRLTPEEKTALANETPMRRWGMPNEVGETIAALVSDKFSFVTGQTIIVDGGTVMR